MGQGVKNFSDTIKDLEEQLNSSSDIIVSFNTKYRAAQDKIDKLNLIMKEEKQEIRYLTKALNELLEKHDLSQFKININDIRIITNSEALVLINNAIRALLS
ncbi:MAG: hypothetical protein ACFFBP_00385 [Promethearchaeota archaeon]